MSQRYELDVPSGESRRLVVVWLVLALGVLAASAFFGLVLALGGAPAGARLLPDVDLYRAASVPHAVLSVLFLFLACAALLWSAVTPRGIAFIQWTAFGCAAAAAVALSLSPVVASGPPVSSRFLPVLDNGMFLAGIGGFALALVLAATLVVARGWPGPGSSPADATLRRGLYLSTLPVAMALVSLAWMLYPLPFPANGAVLAKLLWVPGYLLQFSHVLIMMASWLVLAGAGGVPVQDSPRVVFICFVLTAAPVLLAPLLHSLYPADSDGLRVAYSRLMAFALWPAAAWLGVRLLASAWRIQRAAGGYDSARASLIISVLLFLFGCIAGAAIAGKQALLVVHYHGAVGAMALALMGLAIHLLRRLGFDLRDGGMGHWQPAVFGAGLILVALGLAWLGLFGVPGAVQGSGLAGAAPSALVLLVVLGAGGLLALGGILCFILPVFAALLRGRSPRPVHGPNGSDNRAPALALLLVATVCGTLATYSPPRFVGFPAMVDPAVEQRRAEIEQRFRQGVVMLHAKRYEYAVAAFQRVLKLSPDMPEAHVNMGYALLGLDQLREAADFFDRATTLRPRQANAYWGLAMALERSGDLRAAREAMQAFAHLARRDDPFRQKAEAMLTEWEAKIEQQYKR